MKGASDEQEAEFVDEDEDGNPAASLKKLRERLKKALAEKQEYLDGWQRARADFANYKKDESARDKEREEKIIARFIEGLLPALDALELSLKHDGSDTLKMLEKQFLQALKSMGVLRFGAAGEEANVREYEPLRQQPVSDESHDGTVLSVERSGYKTSDRVIRPAQVTIGKYDN